MAINGVGFDSKETLQAFIDKIKSQRDELVPSVALMQRKIFPVVFNNTGSDTVTCDVTFDTPMPDANYLCEIEGTFGNEGYITALVVAKTATTVTIKCTKVDGSTLGSYILRVIAFKLMTDTVHEADAAHIAQNTANFAPAFSEVTSYAVGDYVTYNNILYRCTTAHTAGTWVAGHFTQVTVGGELKYPYPSSGIITITAVSGATATAITTYTNIRDNNLLTVIIDDNVTIGDDFWGTVSGLSSLNLTHIQNILSKTGKWKGLARCIQQPQGHFYLDLL